MLKPSQAIALRLMISAGLILVLLAFWVDLPKAASTLAHGHWGFFGLIVLLITADRLLMTYKWRLLVVCQGHRLGFWPALRSYYVSTFAGCFLPSTLGADLVRVAQSRRPDLPGDFLAASVIVERALGFVAAALAALIALALLASLVPAVPRQVAYWSVGLLLAASLAVLASLSPWAQHLTQSLNQRLSPQGRLLSMLGRFLEAYAAYGRQQGTLAWFLLLSFVEQAVPVVGTWLAARALEIPLSLLQATAVAPLALLFTRVPVSFSGFGVVEGLYVAFFSLVGVSPTQGFLLGLVANLSVVVSSLPGALWIDWAAFRRRPEERG